MKDKGPLLSKAFLLSITVFLCGCYASLAAEEIRINSLPVIGAKPAGFGNAFVAIADDASAVFSNPSGICQIKNLTIASSYFKPQTYGDIGENLISIINPFEYSNNIMGAWGVSYLHFGGTFYKEDIFALSLSAASYQLGLASGANIKILRTSIGSIEDIKKVDPLFSDSDPLLNKDGTHGNAFPLLDLGALYRMNKNLQFGICFENVNSYRIKWKTQNAQNSGAKEAHYMSLPKTLRIGSAYFHVFQYPISDSFPSKEMQKTGKGMFTISGEFLQDIQNGDRINLSIGTEALFAEFSPEPMDIAVRFGAKILNPSKIILNGLGGVGFRYMYQNDFGFLLDYAFIKTPIDWQHQLSFSFVILPSKSSNDDH